MKAIVVDDEKHVREALLKMLQIFCPDVEVVGEAESVSTAAKLIQSTTFDLAFLDIQLKGGTSLELLEMFPDRKFHFIFITAFDQFAIEAFRLNAIDYLLKPINPDLLTEAIGKVKTRSSKSPLPSDTNDRIQSHPIGGNHIILRDTENLYIVKTENIVHCEADGRYTRFSLLDGRRIFTSYNLKEYEKLLKPLNFIRSHHAHLVNISHIEMYSRQDGGMLHMTNGDLVPVSYRKRDALIKALQGGAIN